MLAASFVSRDGVTVFGTPLGGDFIAFYTAGRLVSDQRDRLYDLQLQDQMVHATVPAAPADQSMPYVNPPFFALLFAPLAQLPFAFSYLVWILVSVALYAAAVLFALWVSPALPRRSTFLVALAFPPFCMFVLQGGQVSAFGCFALSLAFFLAHSQRTVGAGLALALLLYKPPLLLFVLPMLAVKKQWRTLAGFAVGASLLSFASWVLVGTSGLLQYLQVLRFFYALNNAAAEVFQTSKYVDAGAAIRLLTGQSPGSIRFVLLASAFPLLLVAWRKLESRRTWALAVAATLLLNLYSPIYDCVLLVLPAIWVGPKTIGHWMLAALFVASLFAVPFANLTHVQLLTPLLAVFAWRIWSAEMNSAITQQVIQPAARHYNTLA